MSNTYYKYTKPKAKFGGEGLTQEVYLAADSANNDVILEIATIYEDNINTARIVLTEQEQDDLIAGILERRGAQIEYQGTAGGGELWVNVTKGISAEGNEQSKIHPFNK